MTGHRIYEVFPFFKYFQLRAREQLYERYVTSVCLSVCPSVCLSVCHTLLTMLSTFDHNETYRVVAPNQKWYPQPIFKTLRRMVWIGGAKVYTPPEIRCRHDNSKNNCTRTFIFATQHDTTVQITCIVFGAHWSKGGGAGFFAKGFLI